MSIKREQAVGPTKHYVCQIYRREKNARLQIEQTIECRDSEHAVDRARRAFALGRHAGVDAYSIMVEAEMDEVGMPTFLLRLGDVPEVED